MKTTKHPWFILFLLSVFATLVVSAQVTVTNLQPEHITAADQQIADVVSKFSYWKTMIVPLTLILVAAIKKWVGFIPNKYLPWTGPIIGGLLDLLASKFGFWTGDVGAGAAMGGLATWAHQVLVVQPAAPAETTDVPAGDNEGATKLPLMLLIGVLSVGMLSGCKTPKLEPGGVYAPTNAVGVVIYNDLGLALADASYKFTYETALSVFAFERDNRLAIWALSPDVKHALDAIRPKVVEVDRRWAQARKLYKANPTPAGLNVLQTILAEAQRLLEVARQQVQPVSTAVMRKP